MTEKWTHEHQEDSGGSPFEEELDLFLGTSRIRERPGSAVAISRRLRETKMRRDRAFRASLYGVAAVLLCGGVWLALGTINGGMAAAEEDEEEDVYAEIHLMEETLYGAEALMDEEALETLDLLLGG